LCLGGKKYCHKGSKAQSNISKKPGGYMNGKTIVTVLLMLMMGKITAQVNDSAKITAKAIWGPGMEMMRSIHDSCDSMKYPTFGECFLEQMKKSGASQETIEFTKLTGSEGYMRDFKNTGKVDVAYAVYPFRPNENQVCFLVNGNPNMIDVDSFDYISKVNLKMNKIYKQISKNYPNISVWPGDRSGMDYPAVKLLSNGGQQFIFSYRLQDGCHACKLLGFANLGFNFNKAGKFTGIKVLDIMKLTESSNEMKIQDEYSNPDKAIKVKAGKSFTIALKSNATTGYGWQIAKPIDEETLTNIGKIYLLPLNTIPGAGGKEEWTFIANNSGSFDIKFKYVRSWEHDVKPVKEIVFKVIVE
jgi:predicted secreted protein